MPKDPRNVIVWGEKGIITRRPRAIGKGWEYHLDSLPEATRAYLYAQAGETESSLSPSPIAQAATSPAGAGSPVAGGAFSSSDRALPTGEARVIAFPSPRSGARSESRPAAHAEPRSETAPVGASPSRVATVIASGAAPYSLLHGEAVSVPVAAPVASPSTTPSTPLPADPSAEPLSLDALQRYAAERSLRLTLKDLKDPEVQKRLGAARAVAGAGWGEMDRTITAQARAHGVSGGTIRRWVREVEGWQVRARVPQISLLETAIEMPRSRSFDPEAVAAGISLYAGNLKAGRLKAYRALSAEAQVRGWRIGDYTSFTRLVGQVPPQVWEYIKKGEVGFELGASPKIIRAWLSTPAYTVLCGDQNLPDYEIVEPSTGEVYGPQCYVWMDCTSRAWTGLWPAFGPYSRYTVGYSLRECCRLGIMDEAFTDWGKPEWSRYTAQVIDGLKGHSHCGDWAEYGQRYSARDLDGADGPTHRGTTRVGIPWQKPIENQFNVLKRALLDRDIPGFRQRQSGAWENDVLQDDLKHARRGGQLWTTEQFFECLRDIVQDHNRTACRVREASGLIIPQEVLIRSLQAQSRHVFDDQTLDTIFRPRVLRRVNQSTVTVKVAPGDQRWFHAAELSRVRKGEAVQVAFDPFDPDAPAIILTLGGDYLCLAEPWTVQQPGDDAGLSHKIKRQRELMKWWRREVARIRAPLVPAGGTAVPRISPMTKVAKAAARAEEAKPDKGAAARADKALLERFGIAG